MVNLLLGVNCLKFALKYSTNVSIKIVGSIGTPTCALHIHILKPNTILVTPFLEMSLLELCLSAYLF